MSQSLKSAKFRCAYITLKCFTVVVVQVFSITGELYEDNTKMLMSNLGAQAPIMEEDEDEYRQQMIDKNETDEDKKRRLEGKVPLANPEGGTGGSRSP